MKRLGILAALALSACASSHKEELRVEEKQVIDKESQVVTETKQHQETGPVVELEFGPVDAAAPPLKPDGLPPHGPLLRARITGPSTTDLVEVARAQAKEHEDSAQKIEAKKEGQTHPALSCAFGSWLWAGAVIAAVVLAFRIFRRRAP